MIFFYFCFREEFNYVRNWIIQEQWNTCHGNSPWENDTKEPRLAGINHIINCEEGCEIHAHTNMSVTQRKQWPMLASPWGKQGRKYWKKISPMTFKVHRLFFHFTRIKKIITSAESKKFLVMDVGQKKLNFCQEILKI